MRRVSVFHQKLEYRLQTEGTGKVNMKNARIWSGLWMCMGVCLFHSSAHADLAIVVNPNSPISQISVDEVAELFLAKATRTADGYRVIPIDQSEGGVARNEFYERVVKKSPAQLNSYWSRLIFTGKGRPPFAVTDDAEVMEFVSTNPSMLGYVSAESVNDQVKVVLILQ